MFDSSFFKVYGIVILLIYNLCSSHLSDILYFSKDRYYSLPTRMLCEPLYSHNMF